MNIGSKLTVAKKFVTSKAGRQLLQTQKHSPTILFGAGVIGVVATTVLASKATLQLEDILIENERLQERGRDLLASGNERYPASEYTKDMAKLKVRLVKDVGKLYAPAIIIGVGSIAALTGSHLILSKRYAGVVAAYATLDQTFGDYRQRVRELVGDEQEREIRLGKPGERDEPSVEGKTVGAVAAGRGRSQYARWYSKETSKSWEKEPDYSLVFLKAQQNYMNDLLHTRGHVFLNEVYDALGMERDKAAAVVGWVKGKGGDDHVDFGIYDDDDNFINFMTGKDGAILLDFNVDGVIWDLI